MRVKRQTSQRQRTRSNFRLRAGRVTKGGVQKGCFGFRNRIRVERPSDIAGRQLVSTRVLRESIQNFAAFQINVWIPGFCVVLTIHSRHFLPNSWGCGNPGSWRISTVCGIRRQAARDSFQGAVFCRRAIVFAVRFTACCSRRSVFVCLRLRLAVNRVLLDCTFT